MRIIFMRKLRRTNSGVGPVVLTRREFVATTAVTLALAGLRSVFDPKGLLAVEPRDPFGPLIDDPEGEVLRLVPAE